MDRVVTAEYYLQEYFVPKYMIGSTSLKGTNLEAEGGVEDRMGPCSSGLCEEPGSGHLWDRILAHVLSCPAKYL